MKRRFVSVAVSIMLSALCVIFIVFSDIGNPAHALFCYQRFKHAGTEESAEYWGRLAYREDANAFLKRVCSDASIQDARLETAIRSVLAQRHDRFDHYPLLKKLCLDKESADEVADIVSMLPLALRIDMMLLHTTGATNYVAQIKDLSIATKKELVDSLLTPNPTPPNDD